MKIALVDAFFYEKQNKKADAPGMGLLSIGTILKNDGHSIDIISPNNLFSKGTLIKDSPIEENVNLLIDIIEEKKPDIVGFYSICNNYHISLKIAEKIKKRNKNIKIIFGGPQASATAQLSMKAFSFIDVIVIGEAEAMICDLVTRIENNLPLSEIPSIVYKEKGKVIENKEIDLIKDLDTLPFIDYSLIDNFDEIGGVEIDTGRGCPFSCHFCSTSPFWKKNFRMKSNERIINEIKDLYHNYNKKQFGFVHDNFMVENKRVVNFCNLMIESNLDISWVCSSRVDLLEEKTIKKMKEAGCKSIYAGIETGSPRMQKIINKNIDLEKAWENLRIIDKNNINFILSFIYNFPEETKKDLDKTLRFIINAWGFKNVTNIQLHNFYLGSSSKYQEKYFNSKKNILDVNEEEDSLLTSLELAKDFFAYGKEIYFDFMDIFPHFYKISNLSKKLGKDFLLFYHAIFKEIVVSYKNTVNNILDYYNSNPLDFYYAFKEFNPEFKEKDIDITFCNFIKEKGGKDKKWKVVQEQFKVELEEKKKILKELDKKELINKIESINKKTKENNIRVEGELLESPKSEFWIKEKNKKEKIVIYFNSGTLFIETFLKKKGFSKIGSKEIIVSDLKEGDSVNIVAQEKNKTMNCVRCEKITVLDELFLVV